MTHTILAIDDEMPNLLMIQEFLADDPYELILMESAEEALAFLEEGKKAHAILLDRMMPGMDGLTFLKKLKESPDFRHIPVIMQTAAAGAQQVAEGIEAGVFYYLTKPFKKDVLRSILRSALRDFGIFGDIKTELDRRNAALGRLTECRFDLQTLEDVKNISAYLAMMYPDPESAIMGLKELMINAVEHGNLAIGYDEKTVLNNEGRWEEEVAHRLQQENYKQKRAQVSFSRNAEQIVVIIEDEGPGFEWERFLEMDPARAFDNHGRGIAMSRAISFDEVEYIAPGNKVKCYKALG